MGRFDCISIKNKFCICCHGRSIQRGTSNIKNTCTVPNQNEISSLIFTNVQFLIDFNKK